jgi:hypothetical protein
LGLPELVSELGYRKQRAQLEVAGLEEDNTRDLDNYTHHEDNTRRR